MTQGYGGHRGKLLLGGVEITGVDGATYNRAIQNSEWGGWGFPHDRAAAVMEGAPTFEIEDPAWDDANTSVRDLADSMRTGTTASVYFYPRGQDSTTIYCYGQVILNDDLGLAVLKGEVIRQPFGLIAAGTITEVGF